MDFLAPMAGAMCACPGGYLFIASKCIGKIYNATLNLHVSYIRVLSVAS